MAPKKAFRDVVTASKWSTALSSAWKSAVDKNGTSTGSDDDKTIAPKLTNAEAVQLVNAFKVAAGTQRFPLWSQFAAVAYGWRSPGDDLTVSAKQASGFYPSDVDVMLWLTLGRLADDLDGDNTDARLDMSAVYLDVDFVASVKADLASDNAHAKLKIPLPVCKDKKTGKLRFPRPNDDATTCEPYAPDDPITAAKKRFRTYLILGALAWLVFRKKKRAPRRRR